MKLKTLALVVAVLAVAAIAVWFFDQRADTVATDPRVGQPILENATLARVASVFVRSDGKEVTLADTNPADPAWVVRDYFGLPLDFTKLDRFKNDLLDAKVVRFVSANPERLARMQFGDSRIELRDADGKPVWSLALGAQSGGGRIVKFGDEARAYLAGLNAWIDTTPKNWADSRLVPAKADQVVGLVIRFPGGDTLRFVRVDAKAAWKCDQLPQGINPKDSALGSLVSRLTELRFTETTELDAPDAVAAREHARSLDLVLADGRTISVAMGRRPAPPAPPPAPAPETAPAPAADAPAPADAPAAPDAETKPPEPPAPPPAGPVYAFVTSSNAADPINASMAKRGFQISEWTFNELPADRAAVTEKAPEPPPPATPPSSEAPPLPPPAAPADGT
jgi:hypothetical protein